MALTEGLMGVGQTVGASEELMYDADGNAGKGCTTLMVRCVSSSAVAVLVRIEAMHGTTADTGVRVAVGERQHFRFGNSGIRKVYATGNGGTATIDWGPTAIV